MARFAHQTETLGRAKIPFPPTLFLFARSRFESRRNSGQQSWHAAIL